MNKKSYLYPEHYYALINTIDWSSPEPSSRVFAIVNHAFDNPWFLYWMSICPARVSEFKKIIKNFSKYFSVDNPQLDILLLFHQYIASKQDAAVADYEYIHKNKFIEILDSLDTSLHDFRIVSFLKENILQEKKIIPKGFFIRYDFLDSSEYETKIHQIFVKHFQDVVEKGPKKSFNLKKSLDQLLRKCALSYGFFVLKKILHLSVEKKAEFFHDQKRYFDICCMRFLDRSELANLLWRDVYSKFFSSLQQRPTLINRHDLGPFFAKSLGVSCQDSYRLISFYSDSELQQRSQEDSALLVEEQATLQNGLASYFETLKEISYEDIFKKDPSRPIFTPAFILHHHNIHHPLDIYRIERRNLFLINSHTENYFCDMLTFCEKHLIHQYFLNFLLKMSCNEGLFYLAHTILTVFKTDLAVENKSYLDKTVLIHLFNSRYNPRIIWEIFLETKKTNVQIQDFWQGALDATQYTLLPTIFSHFFENPDSDSLDMDSKSLLKTLALSPPFPNISTEITLKFIQMLVRQNHDHAMIIKILVLLFEKHIFSNSEALVSPDIKLLVATLKDENILDLKLLQNLQYELASTVIVKNLGPDNVEKIYDRYKEYLNDKESYYNMLCEKAFYAFIKIGTRGYFMKVLHLVPEIAKEGPKDILKNFFSIATTCRETLEKIVGKPAKYDCVERLLHLVVLYSILEPYSFDCFRNSFTKRLKNLIKNILDPQSLGIFTVNYITKNTLIYLIIFGDLPDLECLSGHYPFLFRMMALISHIKKQSNRALKPLYYEMLWQIFDIFKEDAVLSNSTLTSHLSGRLENEFIYTSLLAQNKIEANFIAQTIEALVLDDFPCEKINEAFDMSVFERVESVSPVLFGDHQIEFDDLNTASKKRKIS